VEGRHLQFTAWRIDRQGWESHRDRVERVRSHAQVRAHEIGSDSDSDARRRRGRAPGGRCSGMSLPQPGHGTPGFHERREPAEEFRGDSDGASIAERSSACRTPPFPARCVSIPPTTAPGSSRTARVFSLAFTSVKTAILHVPRTAGCWPLALLRRRGLHGSCRAHPRQWATVAQLEGDAFRWMASASFSHLRLLELEFQL
jgi:hypothetical protein